MHLLTPALVQVASLCVVEVQLLVFVSPRLLSAYELGCASTPDSEHCNRVTEFGMGTLQQVLLCGVVLVAWLNAPRTCTAH